MKCTKIMTSILIVLIALVGCAHGVISRYDAETHKNIAYMKPTMEGIYSAYQKSIFPFKYVSNLNTDFRYILAYERSKPANEDTVRQIELLHSMFKRHAEERADSPKPWTKEYANNKLEYIILAIDMIIESELAKNR